MPIERLHKVLAHAGFGSRRKCEELIAAGAVQVDGKVVTEMGVKVDAAKQKIKCDDQYVRMPAKVVYLLNKPRGVVATTKDDRGRRTVVDCLKGVRDRVYPAGRLDAESQGMIVLTNDGDLTEKLTHPRHGIPKMYHVVVVGELPNEIVEKARKGVWLSEGKTAPARVDVVKRTREVTVLEVTLREGMNREVRRIFARYGFKVKRLKRVRIGTLALGALPEGQFRRLGPDELAKLQQAGELERAGRVPSGRGSRAVRHEGQATRPGPDAEPKGSGGEEE